MANFMRKGTMLSYFLTSLAAPAAPTAAELSAGTALRDKTATVTGFTFMNQPISIPNLGSAFENKIPGQDAAEDSSMEFYEDNTTNPIKTALAKNTVGWIVFRPLGTTLSEVFPVIVASNARMYTADNEAAKYKVAFTVTSAPIEGTVV